MKRTLILALAVLMLVVAPAMLLRAEAATIVDSGACGENLTWTLDSEGLLTISGTGDMEDYGDGGYWYDSDEAPWDSQRSSILSVVLEECVTSIGDYAFYYCTNMTGITIPDSVTSIGWGAFDSCNSLEKVEITDIAAWCNIEFPFEGYDSNPLYYASKGLFLNGELVTSVVLPDSVTSISDYAFCGYTQLTSITIPESVTSIGEGVFEGCESLSKVEITDVAAWCNIDFEGYGSNPLYYTDNGLLLNGKVITSVVLPDSVTSIPDYTFRNCASLSSITIPNSVTSIGDEAFSGCLKLSSITIPDSITSIGYSAFSGCLRLSSITIPDGVTSIGASAFSGCLKLNSITIPEGVTSIGYEAFYDCDSLSSITIPDSVTSIGSSAFYSCTSLSSITIPKSLTSIGNDAFMYCNSLENVEITDIAAWCNINFADYDSNPLCYADNGLYLNGEPITSAVLPSNITSIPDYAFRNCASLSSITIPDSVTFIGDSAFEGCASLKRVEITDIAEWCNIDFEDYYSNPLEYASNGLYINDEPITSVVLPDRVTSIPDSAFRNCTKLSSITIPDNVTSIGYAAFANCTSLKSITIPDIVSNFGSYAFSNCTSLSSVTILEGVEYIPSFAFDGCTSLCSITIPASLTGIDSCAFDGCTNLESIWVADGNLNYSSDDRGVLFNKNKTRLIEAPKGILGTYSVPESVTAICEDAFRCCASLTGITIPTSVTSIGSYAFSDCYSLVVVHYGGTEAQKDEISIGYDNWYFEDAEWHYECTGTNCPEPPPVEENNPNEFPADNPFGDVAEDAYYFAPVLWAVENGITNGLSADTFGPEATCTRGQIVTFLWRANGSPEPKMVFNPFSDVSSEDYFYDAVLWAVENGITGGMGDGTFAPGAPCTRGQVATFLWRAEGQPYSYGENIFSDISYGAYYYDAVLWAVEEGITNGMGEGIFAPDATCTRGQIVTFLYRAMN